MERGWQIVGVVKRESQTAYHALEAKATNPEDPGQYGADYGIKVVDGGIIEMRLDMNKLQLSFKVNDIDHGIAHKNIEDTQYKAAMTLCNETSKFTFLSHATGASEWGQQDLEHNVCICVLL